MAKKQNERGVLTDLEWGVTQRLLMAHHGKIANGVGESVVFAFVMSRTLSFRKFAEWISTRDLVQGRPAIETAPCGFSRWLVARSRKRLIDSGVILSLQTNRYTSAQKLTVNVPEIIRDIHAYLILNNASASACKIMNSIIEKTWAHFGKCGWHVKEVDLKLDEVKAVAATKSEVARKRRLAKIKDSQMNARKLQYFINELCDEYRQPHYTAWTRKAQGQAKNWIKEIEELGLDVQEVLRDVIRWWYKIRNAMGGPLGLHNFTFEDFYKHRRKIMDLVISERKNWAEEDANKVVWMVDSQTGKPMDC